MGNAVSSSQNNQNGQTDLRKDSIPNLKNQRIEGIPRPIIIEESPVNIISPSTELNHVVLLRPKFKAGRLRKGRKIKKHLKPEVNAAKIIYVVVIQRFVRRVLARCIVSETELG